MNNFLNCCFILNTRVNEHSQFIQRFSIVNVAIKCLIGLFFFYPNINEKYEFFNQKKSANMSTDKTTASQPFTFVEFKRAFMDHF